MIKGKSTLLTTFPLVYLDTSAYLALVLGEKKKSEIETALINCAVCSSSFFILEVERNLVRLSRERVISEEKYLKLQKKLNSDLSLFTFKNLDLEICTSGVFPAVKTPKSSDLIHLRTAIWFINNEKLDGFLTLDLHQMESARELKIPIIEI